MNSSHTASGQKDEQKSASKKDINGPSGLPPSGLPHRTPSWDLKKGGGTTPKIGASTTSQGKYAIEKEDD